MTTSVATREAAMQQRWREHACFAVAKQAKKPKYVCLSLPANLADQLHLGHCRNHIITDVMARFQRMQGNNVLHAVAWDTFGLQTHLAAKTHNEPPEAWSQQNRRQAQKILEQLGISIDWEHAISTCEAEHYRWLQTLFVRLWQAGELINPTKAAGVAYWDPGTQTYLSLRHLVNGRGPESGMLVEVHEVANYEINVPPKLADALLTGLEQLPQWERSTRNMQRESIGKELGLTITFPLVDIEGNSWPQLAVFTSRPDTLMGTTFLAVGADHPIAKQVALSNEEVAQFCTHVNTPTYAYEQIAVDKRQEGMPLGLYALNPLNGDHIPVWVANFVVAGYGTNSILGVPGHDQRNFNFAQRHNLPLRRVELASGEDLATPLQRPLTDKQALPCNSGPLEQPLYTCKQRLLTELAAQQKQHPQLDIASTQKWRDYWDLEVSNCVLAILHQHGVAAELATVTRLRNWKISTQDYWGSPVPLIHCAKCGPQPVPATELPVHLPPYEPGKDALADYPDFVATKCPHCGDAAQRDTDTLASLVDTSWLHLRVAEPTSKQFLPAKAAAWLPIDFYCCGVENATNNLLSLRLLHQLLRANKLVPPTVPAEPVRQILSQGLVLNYGLPMAKTYANTIAPSKLVTEFGADVLRLYLGASVDPRHPLHWDDHKLFALQGMVTATEFTAFAQQKLTGPKLTQLTTLLTKAEANRLQTGLLDRTELAALRQNNLRGAKLAQVQKLLSASELQRFQHGLLSMQQLRAFANGDNTHLAALQEKFSDLEIDRLRHGLLSVHEYELFLAGRLPAKLHTLVAQTIPADVVKKITTLKPRPHKPGAISKLQKLLDANEERNLELRHQHHELVRKARTVLSELELVSLRQGLLDAKQFQALRTNKLRGKAYAAVKKLLSPQELLQITKGLLEREQLQKFRHGKLTGTKLAHAKKILGADYRKFQTHGLAASKIRAAKASLPDQRRLGQFRRGELTGTKLAGVMKILGPKGYQRYLASMLDSQTWQKLAGFINPSQQARLVNFLPKAKQQALDKVLTKAEQRQLVAKTPVPRPLLRFLDSERMDLLLNEVDDKRMDALANFISLEKMEQLLGFPGLLRQVLTTKQAMINAGRKQKIRGPRVLYLAETLAAITKLYVNEAEPTASLQLNRIINKARELLKFIEACDDLTQDSALVVRAVEILLKILHPLIPHVTEDLWQQLGFSGILAQQSWPKVTSKTATKRKEITVQVQLNGRHQLNFVSPSTATRTQLRSAARKHLTQRALSRGFALFPNVGEEIAQVEWANTQHDFVINFVVRSVL